MLTTLVPTALRLCTRWLAMVACFGPRRRCRPAQTFALKKPPGLSGAHCHGGTHRHLLSLAWPEQASAGANGRRAECSGQRTHGRWGSRACGQDMPRCRRGQRFPGRGRHDPIRIFLLSGGGGDRLAWWFVCRCRHLDFRFLPNAALVVIADQVPCITSPVFALLAGQQVACGAPIASKEQEHWPLGSGGIRAGPGLFARDCCRSRGAQVLGRSGASGPYQLAAPGRSFQLLRSEPQRRRSTARAIGPSGAWLLGVAVCDRQPTTPVTPRLGAEIGSWWGC